MPTFLDSLSEALTSRRKAIRHMSREFTFAEVEDRKAGMARMEISLRREKGRVRIWVWEDRWIWIDLREPSKAGWRWQATTQGRLLDAQAERVVAALEAMMTALPWPPSQAGLEAICAGFLAAGPRPVHYP